MAQILNRGRPLQRLRDPWPIGADAPFDAPSHGTGGVSPPPGFVFLVDADGAYLPDGDGSYLMEPI